MRLKALIFLILLFSAFLFTWPAALLMIFIFETFANNQNTNHG
jgi:hypothetical protein